MTDVISDEVTLLYTINVVHEKRMSLPIGSKNKRIIKGGRFRDIVIYLQNIEQNLCT